MDIKNIINEIITEIISENKIWYHGTPDNRELKQIGGFTQRTGRTDYISNPKKWHRLQNEMQNARTNDNEDLYFKLLDQAGALRKQMTYKKPIYFTDKSNVANTYADDKRALDYQNAEPALLQANIDDSGNILKVNALGENFRGIKTDIVRNALINAGINNDKINDIFNMFPTDIRNGKMTAETLAIIAQLLGFDIVDIQGVLDSYHVGNTKSTVRMIFDPKRINIIN